MFGASNQKRFLKSGEKTESESNKKTPKKIIVGTREHPKSSVENDDFYSDDDNPFAEKENNNPFDQPDASNPFKSSDNPFDNDHQPEVYDTNPFQSDDNIDETDIDESVFETVIKDDFNQDNDVYDFVDFSPIHKCLHILSLIHI